jgi:hypothetical protein
MTTLAQSFNGGLSRRQGPPRPLGNEPKTLRLPLQMVIANFKPERIKRPATRLA